MARNPRNVPAPVAAPQTMTTVSGNTAVPTVHTAAPVAPPQPDQRTVDAGILTSILNRYGADRGRGLFTGNVHWSVKTAERGTKIGLVMADGRKVADSPTIYTLIGAAFGVVDFQLTDSISGRSKVWSSKAVEARVKAAGFAFTSRGKLTTAENLRNLGRRDSSPAAVSVTDVAALI